MQWTTEDLFRRLPSNIIIRQAMAGTIAVPETAILHSVYQNALYRMEEKRQEKHPDAQLATMAGGNSGAPGTSSDAAPIDSSGQQEPDLHPGIPPALIASVLSLSPPQRVARIGAMQPPDADAFFRSLRGAQKAALVAGMSPQLRETVGALENPERTVVEELIAERLTRDIYSSAQLQELMTDFWLNHFNVFLRKNPAIPYYLVSYERDVIRPHALGKFEDLLEGVAHSPAMLVYLDNASSTGPDSPAAERTRLNSRHPNATKNRQGLNENYARELMELHTLGVNGGYSQADVIQVARVLTGWTVDRPLEGAQFRFAPNRHEPGNKKVMGRNFKEGGEREGRELLHFLATRPATAQFICSKLAVRFVSDHPPASLVDRMAATWLSSGGDISAVLKILYRCPEFWSTDCYRAKVKTPLEYVVSAVRAANADTTNLRPLANALREMGMPLYGSVPPTGYKWESADWVSTAALVSRMNFALALAANRLPGVTIDWMSPSPAATLQSEEMRLEMLLLPGGVSQTTRAAVLHEFETHIAAMGSAQPMQAPANSELQNHAPTIPERQDRLLAGLLLGSPEFQRR